MTTKMEPTIRVERDGTRIDCTIGQLPTVLAHLNRTAATAKPRPPARAAKPPRKLKPARRRSSRPRQSRGHNEVFRRLPDVPMNAAEARALARAAAREQQSPA